MRRCGLGRRSVGCCAVLCCAVLCCAVLCCAVLCCAVLCCAVLCCAVHADGGQYLCCTPDLREKSKRALKAVGAQCTSLGALQVLLPMAPLPILIVLLAQFEKVRSAAVVLVLVLVRVSIPFCLHRVVSKVILRIAPSRCFPLVFTRALYCTDAAGRREPAEGARRERRPQNHSGAQRSRDVIGRVGGA